MDAPFSPGKCISEGFYRHYNSKKNNEISRFSGVKDLAGNFSYFAVRTIFRVGVLATRMLLMLKEIPSAFDHGGKKKECLNLRVELFKSSAKRVFIFPIIQLALTIVGSIGEIFTWGDWQQYSVDLLHKAHIFDFDFDAEELDCEYELRQNRMGW